PTEAYSLPLHGALPIERARTQLAEEVGALPEDARVRRLRKPHHRLVRVVETLYTLECGAEALAVAPHATELAPLPEDDDPAHEGEYSRHRQDDDGRERVEKQREVRRCHLQHRDHRATSCAM